MDEDILLLSGKGSVASWSPSGLGLSAGHIQMAEGFLDEAFSKPTRMGKATFAGILKLLSKNLSLDLVNTFGILGDPAITLRMVNQQNNLYMPLLKR